MISSKMAKHLQQTSNNLFCHFSKTKRCNEQIINRQHSIHPRHLYTNILHILYILGRSSRLRNAAQPPPLQSVQQVDYHFVRTHRYRSRRDGSQELKLRNDSFSLILFWRKILFQTTF